jgi:hypothetical protein
MPAIFRRGDNFYEATGEIRVNHEVTKPLIQVRRTTARHWYDRGTLKWVTIRNMRAYNTEAEELKKAAMAAYRLAKDEHVLRDFPLGTLRKIVDRWEAAK